MCKVCGYNHCPAGCPNYAPVIAGTCKMCGEEICVGDAYYDMDGNMYCECCFEVNALDILLNECGAEKLTAREMHEEDC